MQENNSPKSNSVDQNQATTEASDKSRLPRHPRWTLQDTFTLIQAKQVAENRGSKSQNMGSVFGSNSFEPKWDFVSSFCKQHGVERGPPQCRKRWGNLVCDFRKVKTWESQVREEGFESFWMMKNESRKENKLPVFFDREVYDLLDGEALAGLAYPLRVVREDSEDGDEGEERESFVGNKAIILKENGLFSGFGDSVDDETSAGLSARETSPTHDPYPDTTKEKQPNMDTQEGRKRKRTSSNGYEDTSLKKLLIEVLDKNFAKMDAQLNAQNMNTQLDREQRKEQDGNLVGALTRIADALGRIADKL